VFTVVDSILNWSPDRMGIAALYHATRRSGDGSSTDRHPSEPLVTPPSEEQVQVAGMLKSRFEAFVRRECQIKDGKEGRIEEVYKNLFSHLARTVGMASGWVDR